MLEAILTHWQRTGLLHHAYLVVGQELWPAVAKLLAVILKHPDLGGHPDVHYGRHETFNLEDSRWLRAAQSNRPVAGGRRFFVLEFDTMTETAQQALLKTLEEPAGGSHFFLLTPSADKILLTLQSRCHVIKVPPAPLSAAAAENLRNFLAAGPAKRLALLNPLWRGEAEEKRSAARRWLQQLEFYLAKNLTRPAGGGWRQALKEVWQAKVYLADDAAMPRLLLEHLAVVLPSGRPVLK